MATAAAAKLLAGVEVENRAVKAKVAEFRVSIRDAAGREVASATAPLSLAGG